MKEYNIHVQYPPPPYSTFGKGQRNEFWTTTQQESPVHAIRHVRQLLWTTGTTVTVYDGKQRVYGPITANKEGKLREQE